MANEPQTPSSEESVPPKPKGVKHHVNKAVELLFGESIIFTLLIIGLGGVLLYFGTTTYIATQKPTPTPTPTMIPPTPTPIGPTDSGIPIKPNTVSFTRINGEVFMRYKGKIYNQEAANNNDSQKTTLPNPDSHEWYGLVDGPLLATESAGFDELFDFTVLPDKYNFIFIMRWPTFNNQTEYKTYFYDSYKLDNKVANLFTTVLGETTQYSSDYSIPRIRQVSTDGNYIAFNMFACWNCDGHTPRVMLFNMQNTKKIKRIGRVSYFNWRTNGEYGYKEHKVIYCSTAFNGECSEDPDKLPLLTGIF